MTSPQQRSPALRASHPMSHFILPSNNPLGEEPPVSRIWKLMLREGTSPAGDLAARPSLPLDVQPPLLSLVATAPKMPCLPFPSSLVIELARETPPPAPLLL